MSEGNGVRGAKPLDAPGQPGLEPGADGTHAADPTSEEVSGFMSEVYKEYGQPDWPMAAYGGLMALYLSTLGLFLACNKRAGRCLPDNFSVADIILMGVATQKFSRLVTKDWVTSAIRAPFTRYEGPGGPAEVQEKPRGKGLKLAIGELLTCPWCISQWTATFLMYGFVLSPRETRMIASLLAGVSVADFLNLAYTAAEKRS